MKVIGLCVLALGAQAIRFTDLEMSSEENNESLAQQKTMEKTDTESLVNIDKQIDQAGRNS